MRPADAQACYDHIVSDEELRIADGKYLNGQTKPLGIRAKVDPKTEKLAKRDMELALKQRQVLSDLRNKEKVITKDKYAKISNAKKAKGPYRNVKSKIRHSVQKDRIMARNKSAGRLVKKATRAISKSPTHDDIHLGHINYANEHKFNQSERNALTRSYNEYQSIQHAERPNTADFGNQPHYNDYADGDYISYADYMNRSATFMTPQQHEENKSTINVDNLNQDLEERVPNPKYRSLRCPYEGIDSRVFDNEGRPYDLNTRASSHYPGYPIQPYMK